MRSALTDARTSRADSQTIPMSRAEPNYEALISPMPPECRAPGGSRTHTGTGLSRVPLPVGLRGRGVWWGGRTVG